MAKKKPPVGPRQDELRSSSPKATPGIRPAAGASTNKYSQPAASVRPPSAPVSKSTAPDLPIERRPVAWWPPVLLALVAVALYANTFNNEYALDDIAAINQNLFVKQGFKGIPDLLRTEFWHFSNISLGYYRPLSLITFAIEQEYFKDSPHISHVINALLYGLTGLVIGVLLQKWFTGQAVVAFLIGLLFIAHPVHTEIVANIKGRDELMSFLFIATMLLAYWRYLETKQKGWLAGAGLALYLAFLSKESSIVGLALIPASAYWFARRTIAQSLVSLGPFLIVSALFFWQKSVMIGTLSGKPPMDWANYPYAIEKTQVPTTFKFLAYYIKLLIYPHPLVYDYSYNVIPSGRAGDVTTLLGFAAFLVLVGLAWVGFRRRTVWGFGLYWFWITMVPALGFILSRGGILAERFLYAPVLGFAIITVWGVQTLLTRFNLASQVGTDADVRPVFVRYMPLVVLMLVVAGLYSFKTVARNPDWKDNFTLFNSALPYAPTSCQVQRHVANEWIAKGVETRTKADSLLQKMSGKPVADPVVRKEQIKVDTLLIQTSKYARLALDHLQASTRIYPSFGEAYFSMAYVFQKITPDIDSAKYYYKQTIRAANAYAPAYNNLAVIYQNQGLYQSTGKPYLASTYLKLASFYYNRSMQVNPAYQDGRNNWENLKKSTGIDVTYLPDSIIARY